MCACNFKFVNLLLVVINAQLERKQKLALELAAEKQRLENMKKDVALMEENISKSRSYSRKVCRVNFSLFYYYFFIYVLCVYRLNV